MISTRINPCLLIVRREKNVKEQTSIFQAHVLPSGLMRLNVRAQTKRITPRVVFPNARLESSDGQKTRGK